MLQKSAWDLLDPADHSKLRDFFCTTHAIEHTFDQEDPEPLWTRFEAAAEGLGIPLSALLRAYHGEGS